MKMSNLLKILFCINIMFFIIIMCEFFVDIPQWISMVILCGISIILGINIGLNLGMRCEP